MKIVPLNDIPAQTFVVTLNNQYCRINLYQKSTGLFIDLYVQDAPIITGRICRDRDRIVRELYLGFDGDLSFVDQQAAEDPSTPGLGSRFLLYYFTPDELAVAAAIQ